MVTYRSVTAQPLGSRGEAVLCQQLAVHHRRFGRSSASESRCSGCCRQIQRAQRSLPRARRWLQCLMPQVERGLRLPQRRRRAGGAPAGGASFNKRRGRERASRPRKTEDGTAKRRGTPAAPFFANVRPTRAGPTAPARSPSHAARRSTLRRLHIARPAVHKQQHRLGRVIPANREPLLDPADGEDCRLLEATVLRCGQVEAQQGGRRIGRGESRARLAHPVGCARSASVAVGRKARYNEGRGGITSAAQGRRRRGPPHPIAHWS